MDIRAYMQSKGWHWKEVNRPKGITAILNCPFCDDKEKKFAVNLIDGAFSCLHINNCGRKGSWWDLQKALGDKPVKLDSNDTILRQPIVYKRPQVHSEPVDKAVEYLKTRGLTEITIKKFKIGYKDGAIMFPYFKNGELVQVKYRGIVEKKFWKEKDCEPTLFNRDICSGEGLAICEGEIDCMTLAQYDIPAVSIPSGASDLTWIENEWEYLDKFQKIYLFMDGDTAGQQAVENLVKRLGTWRCYSVVLPYKDANECLQKGVEAKVILEAIADAKEFDPPMLLSAKEFQEDVLYLFEHPEKLYGIKTPWDGLNNILKGWRECELTVWSGRNAAGKTSFLNEVIINLLKKDHKVIMASLEMPPKRYLRWIIMNVCNNLNPSRQEIISTFDWMKNLYVVNTNDELSTDEIINIFDFAARKYGVKHFFVDSLMKIELKGIDDLKEQKKFCLDLLGKIAFPHHAHIHLVAHPRKGFRDNDRPDKVDIAGTGDISNLAHNVIIVWRPDVELKKSAQKDGKDYGDGVLCVKKNREWGLEGFVNFDFNSDTKKFTEVI
jgi:twinkle protein